LHCLPRQFVETYDENKNHPLQDLLTERLTLPSKTQDLCDYNKSSPRDTGILPGFFAANGPSLA